MEYVIGSLVLLFLLFGILGVLAVVKTVRAVKRGVETAGAQIRRTVTETTLKARAAQPGPVGELARIRLALRSSIDTTRQVLQAGAADDASLREALSLLDRLQGHAHQLDGELRILMEREPDRTRITTRLPEARQRAERIRRSADSLRWAAQDRARQYEEDGLDALDTQIEIETDALRHWKERDEAGAPGAGPHSELSDAGLSDAGRDIGPGTGPGAGQDAGGGDAPPRTRPEALPGRAMGTAPETSPGTVPGIPLDASPQVSPEVSPVVRPDLGKKHPRSAP